tara:strand:- start:1906 stop:2169 length:264 start_codon:yes stop_codon:yes gene_type:complete
MEFKILKYLFTLTIIIFISGCDKDQNNCINIPDSVNNICIDSSLIDSSVVCLTVYEPVCGCNGMTYSNSCVASRNGITYYEDGECCD